jgi:hypothetical protein
VELQRKLDLLEANHALQNAGGGAEGDESYASYYKSVAMTAGEVRGPGYGVHAQAHAVGTIEEEDEGEGRQSLGIDAERAASQGQLGFVSEVVNLI